MGVFVGTIELANRVQRSTQAVKTFLTDKNGEELFITYNYYNNTIDIINTRNVLNFVEEEDLESPTWKSFMSYTYELMLIVLEKMVLNDIKYEFNFSIDELHHELTLRQKEIKLASKNIRIIN